MRSVRDIAAPIVRAMNLDLVDVECAGQGARMLVRVFIDKSAGVTVDDCEKVHVSLGHALDLQDPIPHAYTLEVSSPGLDRPLKQRDDYLRSIGRLVNLKLKRPVDGQWRVVGRLTQVGDDSIAVTVKLGRREQTEHLLRLEWEAIAEGRLEVEF